MLVGRKREIEKLERLMQSPKSEFFAVSGRRRVGKTFLLREHFANRFDFYATGLAQGNIRQHLANFTISLNHQFSEHFPVSNNWLDAFNLLLRLLENSRSDHSLTKYSGSTPKSPDYFDELLERIRDIRASEKRFYQKVRDLFALSSDYDGSDNATQMFFAETQNKLLFATTRQTAAEIIYRPR